VGGLALTFIAMGVLSSLFGAIIGPRIYYLEKVAGALILAFGVLMLFGVNLFKGMSFFSRLQVHTGGRFGGFFLGFTLGLVWIPCVGPMLSSILAMVASDGRILGGVGMLSLYSAGFAIPMLLAGYATQLFRKRTAFLREHPQFVRLVSGGILVAFGLFVLSKGILGFAA
jgi:cytochrome c-type biogenesis protein